MSNINFSSLNLAAKRFSIILLIAIILTSIFNTDVNAQQETNCNQKYSTLINPVRGRNLWRDKSLSSFKEQYQTIKENAFFATWLLQYDVLNDKDLLNEIKNLDDKQELGVFLEVSEEFAKDSRVIYPLHKAWFDPSIVFLSGYSQSERKKLIDELFKKFKATFGVYPKSVGAWWIDSYSLDYMKRKYNISSALIVADQKTTDNYGIWGQWWGIPYYPSKANILTPASGLNSKQDVVILQWAQRDPLRAFGQTLKESNFSLQANDYLRQGLDINYFKSLVDAYFKCDKKIGQITVGLETGIESIGNIAEYKKQLEVLKNYKNLKTVTMSGFSSVYSKVYPEISEEEISLGDSKWVMTKEARKNEKFKENILYSSEISFSDYFIPDKSDFLDRILKEKTDQKNKTTSFPLYLLFIVFFGIYALFRKKAKIWFFGLAYLFASFGLILRSNYLFGWKVFYGPILEHIEIVQILLTCFVFLIFFIFFDLKRIESKLKDFLLVFLSLSFGVDVLIYAVRFSFISNSYYLGISLDALRFIGISISKNLKVVFLNQDLPAYQASALLRLDFVKFQSNILFSLFLNPLFHFLLAYILFLIFNRLPIKLQRAIFIVFIILFSLYIVKLINSDPSFVLPNV